MKVKLFLCAALAACLVLTGCGGSSASDDAATSANPSQMRSDATAPDESAVQTAQPEESSASQKATAMRNVALGKVPDGYYGAATQQGTLESFSYCTRGYIGEGGAIQSRATVYLPYGYEQSDPSTRYNILYLQHGAYGDERTWMYEYGDGFKNMIDHMIEDGLIPPRRSSSCRICLPATSGTTTPRPSSIRES